MKLKYIENNKVPEIEVEEESCSYTTVLKKLMIIVLLIYKFYKIWSLAAGTSKVLY